MLVLHYQLCQEESWLIYWTTKQDVESELASYYCGFYKKNFVPMKGDGYLLCLHNYTSANLSHVLYVRITTVF